MYNPTITVAFWLEVIVPTTLTLKNIPDDLYERLKAAAVLHHRSLNSEAIVCLESVLTPTKVDAAERLDRIRRLRAELAGVQFNPAGIDTMKREGRS